MLNRDNGGEVLDCYNNLKTKINFLFFNFYFFEKNKKMLIILYLWLF